MDEVALLLGDIAGLRTAFAARAAQRSFAESEGAHEGSLQTTLTITIRAT